MDKVFQKWPNQVLSLTLSGLAHVIMTDHLPDYTIEIGRPFVVTELGRLA